MNKMIPFRTFHLLQLLEEYDPERGPLDRYLHRYFREHKALGSRDRREIAEQAYGIVRHQLLLDELGADGNWQKRVALFESETHLEENNLPDHVAVSCPLFLYQKLTETMSREEAMDLCRCWNTAAPTTIRTNTARTTREELQQRLAGREIPTHFTQKSKTGLTLEGRAPLFTLPEFQDGLFEMQDEASQLVADMVEITPGELLLDYCAGAGGKSLAIAPRMEGKGQLFLYDIRPHILLEARQRLRRAGVQNCQTVKQLAKLKKKMHWVLVDAPCSGTGTLRRNPDLKWRLTEEGIRELVGKQRMIFEKALSHLKPGGTIVYATCSILPEENEQQRRHFLEHYPLQQTGDAFKSLPTVGGMDGFYAVSFTHK